MSTLLPAPSTRTFSVTVSPSCTWLRSSVAVTWLASASAGTSSRASRQPAMTRAKLMALLVFQFELAPQQRAGIVLDPLQGVAEIRGQPGLRIVFPQRAELMRRGLVRRLGRLRGQRLVHLLLQCLLSLFGLGFLFGPLLRTLWLGLVAGARVAGFIRRQRWLVLILPVRRLAAVLR